MFRCVKIFGQIAPFNLHLILIVIIVNIFEESLVIRENVRNHIEIFVLKIIA